MMAMMRTNDSQNKMSCPCHTWYVSYEMFADVQRRVRKKKTQSSSMITLLKKQLPMDGIL